LIGCALSGSYLWSSHFPLPEDLISPRYPALRVGVEAAYFAAPGVALALSLLFAASSFLRTNLGGRLGRLLHRCIRFPLRFVRPWSAVLLVSAAAATAANWHYQHFPAPGSDPRAVLTKAQELLRSRRNILVSGGTGSVKTTLLNALIELHPQDDRVVSIEDTLELKITRLNSLRFEAGQLSAHNGKARLTIRDLVRHALRHRPDHIVVGEVRGGEAADLLQALNTGHGGSLTTIHANNAESALSRLANCAMQDSGALPWEVTCRNVVDGIAMVIHLTRREEKRFVEEAIEVGGYDSGRKRFSFTPALFR